MSDNILDGKAYNLELRNELVDKIKSRKANGLVEPCLSIVLVGDSEASKVYVQNKVKTCEKIGMRCNLYNLPISTTTQELLDLVNQLNTDKLVNGIIVQLPLPDHIDTKRVVESINEIKDVDGFSPYHLGRLMQRSPLLRPCTPYGIMQLLTKYNIDVKGINATVVGASSIVGRPMAIELLNKGATVTICHRFTKNLKDILKNTDLLVVAVGKPELIKGNWLKPGVIVIDVGINRLPNGKLVGDVEFKQASKLAKYITPVPGGVGPLTIATLLQNVLRAQELQENIR